MHLQQKKIGIFHTAFLGDLVLTTLLIEALHKNHFSITLFTKEKCASLFQNDPRLEKVVVVYKGKFFGKFKSMQENAKKIDAEKCDVLLVPHRSLTSSFTAFFSKTKIKIGFQTAVGHFLYPVQVPFLKEKHECVRYLELLHPSYFPMEEKALFVSLGRPVLPAVDVNPHRELGTYFVLSLGSQWATKKYPARHYAVAVFHFLLKYPDQKCVLTGTRADEADAQDFLAEIVRLEIEKNCSVQDRIISFLGKQNLSALSKTIAHSEFVLCNDSSPIHFAAGFDKPCLAIFGPTHVDFGFGPTSTFSKSLSYEDEHGENSLSCRPCSIHGQKKCPLGHHKCMVGLAPQVVLKWMRRMVTAAN